MAAAHVSTKTSSTKQSGFLNECLYKAVMVGDISSVEYFLNRGAVLSEKSDTGVHPFVNICSQSGVNPEIIELLLKHNAHTFCDLTEFNRALMNAIISENPDVVRLLVKYGGNIHNAVSIMDQDRAMSYDIQNKLVKCGFTSEQANDIHAHATDRYRDVPSKGTVLKPLLDEAVSSNLLNVFDPIKPYNGQLVIATGLAGSGKSLYMNKIRETEPDSKVIVVDNFRYVPDSSWVKRPRDEFIKAILDEILSVPPTKVVYIDSALYDAHDPSHARELLLLGLLMYAREVRIFTYETALEQATALIQRSFGRLTGERDAGACPESAESVAKMVLKNSSNFEKNTEALKEYVTIAKEFGMIVHHNSKNTTILLTPENRLSVSD